MNAKLQELTDKIYQEGVEKGTTEAQSIIRKADAQAADIIAEAERKAAQILSDAELKAAELFKNTQTELRLYGQQSVDALKTKIADLLTGTIVSDSVKAATVDKEFMQKLILTLVREWAMTESLTIQTKDAVSLTEYFVNNAKELLNNVVEISEVNGVKSDFTIIPSGGGYRICIGDDEFIAYFKEFLRPKLVEMLF